MTKMPFSFSFFFFFFPKQDFIEEEGRALGESADPPRLEGVTSNTQPPARLPSRLAGEAAETGGRVLSPCHSWSPKALQKAPRSRGTKQEESNSGKCNPPKAKRRAAGGTAEGTRQARAALAAVQTSLGKSQPSR